MQPLNIKGPKGEKRPADVIGNATILSSIKSLFINGSSARTAMYFSSAPPPLMPVSISVADVLPMTRTP